MTYFKTGSLFLMLSLLSACGAKLVEFELDAGSPEPLADAGPQIVPDAGPQIVPDAGQEVAPTILSVLPVDAATGVAFNTSISATFSKAMDPATLSAATFSVTQGATNIAGAVTYAAATNTATFVPSSALGASLVYTALVTNQVKDVGGLAMAANYTWVFTTAANALPPTVISTTPLDVAINVSTSGKPTATFSKAMDPATLTTATFTVTQGATPVSGTVALNGATNTATFSPAVALATSLVYTATITTGAKDSGALAMAANYVWTFTTAAVIAPPTVIATTPLNLAINVPLAVQPTATFSTAMNAATLTSASFTLMQGVTTVAGAVTFNALTDTATFAPAAPLTLSLVYTATITTQAQNAGGVALAANYVWTFTTLGAVAPPTVTAVLPLNLAINVPTNAQPSATFSKAMDAATLTTASFTLKQGLTAVTGTVALNAVTNTATFSPTAPLSAGLVYTATVTTAAKDTGGLSLAANYVWTFTTASTPPTVLSVTPLNNAINVSIATKPTATFSKAMDPATISALTFTLKQGLVAVSGAVTYDALTNTAKFAPTSPLGLSLVYTATITTGAKDPGGTALASAYVWSFTTGACSQAPIDLLTAANFVVLGGSTVTNTGLSIVTGDLGVSPGTAVTGFGPGTLIGTMHAGDVPAAQGIADLTTAYNEAAGRSLCPVTVSGNIGGQTLYPGLYKSTSSLAISSGDLTLDAQGDSSAVFIFQSASTLTTTSGRQVILAGGAKSANIFWQVGSSATLGTTSAFYGTIMADQAVTLLTGATLNGRALARIAGVTLDSNIVDKPAP
jgi:hypothetical protein